MKFEHFCDHTPSPPIGYALVSPYQYNNALWGAFGYVRGDVRSSQNATYNRGDTFQDNDGNQYVILSPNKVALSLNCTHLMCCVNTVHGTVIARCYTVIFIGQLIRRPRMHIQHVNWFAQQLVTNYSVPTPQ